MLGSINFFILCPLIFVSGFVDAVAGGGGLISLPAYRLAGLPMHNAIATNKLSAGFGLAGASWQFWRSGNIELKPALSAIAGALLGAWLGARLALVLPDTVLQLALMVLLPLVAVFLLFNRGFGAENSALPRPAHQLYPLAAVIGLGVGVYDGFFGPGAGTFLILAFTGLLRLPLVRAAGCAKVVNLASCLASLVTYLLEGKVVLAAGVPCILCALAGSLLGSKLAIKNSARFIRPLIVVVIALLFGTLLIDFFQGGRP